MEKDNVKYNAYVQILKEELLPAMGCTEPIALAYGAALARKYWGNCRTGGNRGQRKYYQECQSVIVLNTDHLKGIPAAATAGTCR